MASLSLRARRQRKQARQRKGMTLNIISLIDIFTVLVFFLLLNSTELELLPESKDVRLPESVAESRARETVVVMVNRNEILVQGAAVAKVDEVMASDQRTIPTLEEALNREIAKAPVPAPAAASASPAPTGTPAGAAEPPPREVTIMGDREIPYRLLKKVLASCADADYGKLSLAVLQKAGPAAARPLTRTAP